MNKLVLIILALCIASITWWFFGSPHTTQPPAVSNGNSSTTIATTTPKTPTTTKAKHITRQPSAPDRQVYINQDWRFSFEYPVDSEIDKLFGYKPIFLVDFVIRPKDSNIWPPVTIFLSPDEWYWADKLIEKKEGDILIGGLAGWYYNTVTMSVIPKRSNFVLVNNEYWIHIGILNEYLDEYQMVLDTFKFHEPTPSLSDLEVDTSQRPKSKYE